MIPKKDSIIEKNININFKDRLDIFIKILYIKWFIENKNFSFYRNMYVKHIKLFNWCIEDNKNNIKDFENSFQNLIYSFKKKWFKNKHSIPLNKKWEIINWAHRLACCIYFNIKPNFKITNKKGIYWWINWFKKNYFSENEIKEIINLYNFYNFNKNISLENIELKNIWNKEIIRIELLYLTRRFFIKNQTKIDLISKMSKKIWIHKYLSYFYRKYILKIE